jgi:tRNA1Val (adenine37-N6)-methyltransferase
VVAPSPPDATCDELLRGKIRVWQPRRGHRVSLDALFLADFARRGGVPRRILDLGCGVGVVAIALLAADGEATALGLELQPELAELARRNVGENRLDGRLAIVEGDLREARELGAFDAVVANPPFFRGRTPPAAERAVARHEVSCTMADVAAAARRFVTARGLVALVYPAERLVEVIGALDAAGLAARVLRFVHSVAGEPARRVLVEAAPGWRGGVTVLAPLVVHGADRKTYTPEAAAILGD